jgi:hypothetical protein
MTEEVFLPEDDQDFLRKKAIAHHFHSEGQGETLRRAIELIDFDVPPNLYKRDPAGPLVPATKSNILVLIPKGYATTRLDSWYARPALLLADGNFPNCAGGQADMFGNTWQFWSRHLDPSEWRDGVDGLETYLQYIRSGLRTP